MNNRILIGLGIALIILAFLAGFYFSRSNSNTVASRGQPNPTIDSSVQDIDQTVDVPSRETQREKNMTIADPRSVNFSSEDESIAFSLDVPYPGDYCNGCVDGMGGLDQTVLTNLSVRGGYDSPDADSSWAVVIDAQKQQEIAEANLVPDEYVKELVDLGITESMDYDTSIYNLQSTLINQNDIKLVTKTDVMTVNGTELHVYEADLTNGKRTQFALFEQNGWNVRISHVSENEDDTFDAILSSLRYELEANPDF